MALFEGKTPAERNKTIAALAFGLVALVLLGRMFFGSSGSGTTTPTNANRRTAARNANAARGAAQQDERIDTAPQPVPDLERIAYDGGEAGRNIFAFFARPQPAPPALPAISPTPEPTPTPPPPIMLGSLTPPNVYAQTGEFALKLSGDKFTPAVRVYVDNQEVPTQFGGPQQLTATVPPFLITAPGNRQITVRTPDGALYSNQASLNVMQPPVPTYTYIGFISRPRSSETAVLKDQKNDLLSVQRNDIVGGRFQVMGITARAVELQDKDLKIKHTLPYVAGAPGGPIPRGAIPPPRPPPDDGDGDDEP